MVIFVFWMACKTLRAMDAARYNPCISLSGMEALVWFILVLSTSFDILLMTLVVNETGPPGICFS